MNKFKYLKKKKWFGPGTLNMAGVRNLRMAVNWLMAYGRWVDE